jgi:beta propeller repeat protein
MLKWWTGRGATAFVRCAVALLCLLMSTGVYAQQQFQGVCARVKMQILQELTIERIGFEATLELTNNDGDEPITDFSAELTFENPALTTNSVPNDASTLFFVRVPTMEDVTDVTGSGIIGPTKKAVIRWFIIPKISAGGTDPAGIRYKVGARLSAKLRGVELTQDVLRVVPDDIFVKPEPQLEITYFQPRDVQGDDPFTPQVESPIPFTIGVIVKNSGHGMARKVKINSQQPKIVENRTSLLLIAQLLGARVNDSPLQRASLLVDLGDIPPGQARKGAWDMITSLSGEFTEFKATYTHASELGGEETSVIKSLEAHFIAHEVLNDQPGRDTLLDFLADTDRDANMVPDAIYESEGNILPVNELLSVSISGSGLNYQVSLDADREGWGYIRLADPGQSRLRIVSVVRSDGKVLNPHNAWTNFRYDPSSNARLDYLNILDLVQLGSYTYSITYSPSVVDPNPPVTTLNFAGVVTQSGGKYYITPDTQMFFLSDDESPVSIVYSLTNGPFLPAIPFRVRTPGEYGLRFYATDASGNRESTNTTTLVVYDEPPALASANVAQPSIVAPGDALSIRPSDARISFQAQPDPTQVDADIEIFRGVVAWATLRGVPSSPTSDTGASLVVGGDNVDFYRYRIDGGGWSADQPLSAPLSLSGLSAGPHRVDVLGRSQYGGYLPDTNAVQVNWVVDSSAPAARIVGAPATPTHDRSADLTISGAGVTDYRWTINGGFYRAETSVTNPLVLTALTGTQQVVSVIGKVSGVFQPTNNATTVNWNVNPGYGGDFASLTRVRSVNFTNVGTASVNFSWDGRGDDGVIQAPGWYLVKVTLRDQLGRFSFATRLVNVAEMAIGQSALADASRGARRSHARGHWTVWQDQSDGNFEIYAMDLRLAGPVVTQITSGALNQENPKTDGRYVVWQARQLDGDWDVWLKELGSTNPAQAVTSTTDADEVNPAIDWPWVVYQSRPTSNPGAPWQLRARNLVTSQTTDVYPGPQDQLDAEVQAGRVVWQDHRDVGVGEIYFKNLESGEQRRITTNSFGQYFPAIFDQWIVWQDNRNGTVDIYGFDLLRNAEMRITATPENEAHPFLDGPWLVCEEDSLDVLSSNVRLINLSSFRAVPLTRSASLKSRPALTGRRAIWEDTANNTTRIVAAELPAIQAVFQNQNAVPVTASMVAGQQNAFNLLMLWHAQAGVQEIVYYTALVPQVTSQSASWINGQPSGDNFALVPGSFLWVRFDDRNVLDLGLNDAGAINLAAGVNALSYTAFPSQFSAFKLLQQLGLNNVDGVRMLDAESGRWVVAAVENGQLIGEDFRIPNVAVLLLDMAAPVNQFKPQ